MGTRGGNGWRQCRGAAFRGTRNTSDTSARPEAGSSGIRSGGRGIRAERRERNDFLRKRRQSGVPLSRPRSGFCAAPPPAPHPPPLLSPPLPSRASPVTGRAWPGLPQSAGREVASRIPGERGNAGGEQGAQCARRERSQGAAAQRRHRGRDGVRAAQNTAGSGAVERGCAPNQNPLTHFREETKSEEGF